VSQRLSNQATIESDPTPRDPDAHAWGPWAVSQQPTPTTPGSETRVCAHDSSHTETREIPATGLTGSTTATAATTETAAATATGTAGTGGGGEGRVLGAFSRNDIVADNTWSFLDSECEADGKTFRVFAPTDGAHFLVLTPELYAELKGAGYTHLEFVLGDAVIAAPLSAFAGVDGYPVTSTTFVLMIDPNGNPYIAGAYAREDDALRDVYDALSGITLANATKAK